MNRVTLSEALARARLSEFVTQAANGIGAADRSWFDAGRPRHCSYQKVKHPVHPAPVRSAKSELIEIALHVLRADLEVNATKRRLQQPPEAFNGVDVERVAAQVAMDRVLALSVADTALLESVADQEALGQKLTASNSRLILSD